MERKTKHRILGIFVVIGLVIILLPFFQAGKESVSTANLVKAPPFPDQAVQVSSTQANDQQQNTIPIQQSAADENPTKQQPDDTINPNKLPVMNSQAPSMNAPTAAATPASATANSAASQPASPSGAIAAPPQQTSPSAATNENKHATAPIKEVVKPDAIKTSSNTDEDFVNAPVVPKGKKSTHALAKMARTKQSFQTRASRQLHMTRLPINDNGLANLKDPVWVIQLGSFKNKTNALRLVNQLRAKGYRAFIQQVSTEIGDSTRVFVGPENKQNSARALASELETNMHLHGIVISYQPLTL